MLVGLVLAVGIGGFIYVVRIDGNADNAVDLAKTVFSAVSGLAGLALGHHLGSRR